MADRLARADTDGSRPRVLTPRALALGVGLVAVICLIVAYGELVVSRGGSIEAILLGASHMPPAALGTQLPILLINALLRKLAPRWGLNPAELVIVYVMMIIAALLSSFGLATQLLPNLAGTNYFAGDTGWVTLFYGHLRKWMVPYDPAGGAAQPVTKQFYEGLQPGQGVPWGAWLTPLAAWTLLAFMFFGLMVCLASLLRRQWVDGEKLPFPLVQLPLDLTDERTAGPLIRRVAFWLGFAVPVVFHSINGLSNLFPSVPHIKSYLILTQYFRDRPWSDMTYTPANVAFSVTGLSFLLPLDVSFSFWFFLWFSRLQEVIASLYGARLDRMPVYGGTAFFIGYQSVGAAVAIALSMLWLARPHLRLAWARATGRSRELDDRNELVGYRAAFIGMLICFLGICAWCWLAGMNVLIAAALVGSFFLFTVLMLSRAVAEIGLLMLQPVFRPIDVMAIGVPRAALGAQNLTTLSLLDGIFFRDPRILLPAMMDGLRMTDRVNLRRRSLLPAIVVAIVVAVGLAYFIQLNLIYHRGGITLNRWFLMSNPRHYFNQSEAILRAPPQLDLRAPIHFTAGLTFTFFLYAMRARFPWWPFHPLGFALGASWPAIVYWFALFVGWLAKWIILRFGGMKGYQMARPFFLGLILGEFTAAIIWVAVSAITHAPAPFIPLC
jgi:hypothetical protein